METDLRCDVCFSERRDHIYSGDAGLTFCPDHPDTRLLPLDFWDSMSEIKQRLEYLRGEIQAERISYGEIADLESLAEFIEDGDDELLLWAGTPENGAWER